MADNNGASDQIMVSIPGNLMAQIDAQVGSEFADRSDFVLAAVRHYLEYLQNKSNMNVQSG